MNQANIVPILVLLLKSESFFSFSCSKVSLSTSAYLSSHLPSNLQVQGILGILNLMENNDQSKVAYTSVTILMHT